MSSPAAVERTVPTSSPAVAVLAIALRNWTEATKQAGEQPVCTVEARDRDVWDPVLYAATRLSERATQQLADDLQRVTRDRLNTIAEKEAATPAVSRARGAKKP